MIATSTSTGANTTGGAESRAGPTISRRRTPRQVSAAQKARAVSLIERIHLLDRRRDQLRKEQS